MINFVIENDWKWNHCKLPIKRSQKHSKKRDEQYFYQVINSQGIGPINQQKIRITLDRPFPFQPDTGFVWHKSWNLPQITISISQQQYYLLSQQYKEIKCQLMAVYPIKYSSSYYLNQILLEGNCLKIIHQNPSVFKFLKFGETSFNHNRNKFCLVAWVYGQNAYKDKDDIFCLISSPIYVDSRKQARKVQNTNTPVIHSLNKFTAAIKGLKGSVSNSAEGFISYYSAQNIRNKIKHPFYVAYHFDKVFKLFLNIQAKITLIQALSQIQTVKPTQGLSRQGQNAIVLLQIADQNQKLKKKIFTILQKWKFGLIEYSYQGNSLNSSKWLPISKQQIKSCYKIHYQNQILKQEDYHERREQIQQNINQNIMKQNQKIKNGDNSDSKSNNEADKQKTYQLRTIIDLSRPKKKVKIQHQEM